MTELKCLVRSFGYALKGIGYGIATQRNFRIHLTAAAVVTVFNVMARMSVIHWCIEILCCMLVISLELVNTAVETVCDKITDEQHPLIGHAKDASAGAVLMSAIGAVVIALLVFFRGDPAYQSNVVTVLQTSQWVPIALIIGTAAVLVFIFLPSVLQQKKQK